MALSVNDTLTSKLFSRKEILGVENLKKLYYSEA